jgi:hypothetical protein
MAAFHAQMGEGGNHSFLAIRPLEATGNTPFITQIKHAFDCHTTGSREFDSLIP